MFIFVLRLVRCGFNRPEWIRSLDLIVKASKKKQMSWYFLISLYHQGKELVLVRGSPKIFFRCSFFQVIMIDCSFRACNMEFPFAKKSDLKQPCKLNPCLFTVFSSSFIWGYFLLSIFLYYLPSYWVISDSDFLLFKMIVFLCFETILLIHSFIDPV